MYKLRFLKASLQLMKKSNLEW